MNCLYLILKAQYIGSICGESPFTTICDSTTAEAHSVTVGSCGRDICLSHLLFKDCFLHTAMSVVLYKPGERQVLYRKKGSGRLLASYSLKQLKS